MTTTAQAIPTTLPFKQFTQPTTTGIIHYISQQSYDEEDGDKLSEREGQRLTFQALFGKARNPLRHARRNQQSCLVSISLVTTGYIVSLAVGWPFSVGLASQWIHPPLQLALLFSAETALLKAVAYNIARRCGYLLL